MHGDVDTRTADAVSRWERGYEVVAEWVPYVTLAVGAGLSILDSDPAAPDTWTTLGLTLLAAAWVFLMFTDARRRGRVGRTWMRIYFAGLMVIAFALMSIHPIFFVFVITGFFHAYLLETTPAIFVGVFVTSLVINSGIVIPDATSAGLWFYGVIVVVQTLAIGFGIVGGERLTELNEQRRKALLDLRLEQERNAGLEAQLVARAHEAGVADERQRMAREIHDTIAQGLIGVVTQLEAAGSASDPAEQRRRLDTAAGLARESLAEARRSVEALVPRPLEEGGLPEALDQVVTGWSSVNGVPAEMAVTGTPHALHVEVEVTVLRVTQEALANVAKHADASRVGVTLSYMGDVVTIDVRDDGAGIAQGNGSTTAGFGLTAMRQRVEALDGVLEVESAPGRGTAVSARLPALASESAAHSEATHG